MISEASSTLIHTTLGPLMVRRAGRGAPALLWHSLFVDSRTFDGVVEELGRQRELFMVDGPGHGDSPGPHKRYSLEDCATAAAQILDALGISTPVDWVGNAWGGHVGISVMLHRPDLRPVLPRLQVPTLMLAARDDLLNDPKEAERAARTVPDGRFARVSGGGHVAPLLIAPAEVAQHILTFWSANRNRQSAA